jgi:hypothetical protein
MSKFFQISLQKDKINRLEGTGKYKNKNEKEKTKKPPSSSKPSKKFMISPVKEIKENELSGRNNYESENLYLIGIYFFNNLS